MQAQGWCKPSKGCKYADVSEKVFRGWLRSGLRHIRLENNRILIKYDWIDEYLEKHEVTPKGAEIASELIDSLQE